MSSGTSSELSSMESVSQLVLTIECLEGNPHLLPIVNGNGRLIKLFPTKLYCDIKEEIYLRCNNAFYSQNIPLTSVFTHAF